MARIGHVQSDVGNSRRLSVWNSHALFNARIVLRALVIATPQPFDALSLALAPLGIRLVVGPATAPCPHCSIVSANNYGVISAAASASATLPSNRPVPQCHQMVRGTIVMARGCTLSGEISRLLGRYQRLLARRKTANSGKRSTPS